MARILVATEDGLHELDEAGRSLRTHLADSSVTHVVRDGDELWAIVDRREIWQAPDDQWRLVATVEGPRATCIAMTDAIHIGTSEAHLLRLNEGRLERNEAFDSADGRDAWYTPWGGPPATRSIAEWGEDVYVNVHVGGVLRTSDGAASWTPTIDIDADVHQVATAEGLVLAAGARGLSRSADRGSSWTLRVDGLDGSYCRAVVVCGDRLLVSASDGPRGGHAAVYGADLASGSFEPCRQGLPEWFDDNIDTYCLDALNDGSYAAFGIGDGRVYGSRDGGTSWANVATMSGAAHSVLVVPD
jgi:hypothetical protein